MRTERRGAASGLTLTLAALGTLALAGLSGVGPGSALRAQDTPAAPDRVPAPAAKDASGPAPKASRKGGLRLPGGGRPRGTPKRAADPLADAAPAGAAAANPPAGAAPAPGQAAAPAPAAPQGPPKWPFHYTLKLAPESGPLALEYYPAKESFQAPVVLLVHEPGQGRSGNDFSTPIDELKGQGLAAHLQSKGYAVVVPDLRGHGRNGRRTIAPAEWRTSIADLQAVYQFLIDRNNRGELNLARLGVVALGESANLVAAWAGTPGAAVSTEGRISDLGPLVLVSPVADARGLSLERLLPPIAARFPLFVIAGDRDDRALASARAAQPVVERHRLGKVAFHDSALHGTRLIQFVPRIPGEVERFLSEALAHPALDWEPRYLLDPIPYGDVQLVADSGSEAAPGANPNPNPNANANGNGNAPGRPAAGGNRNPAPAPNANPTAPGAVAPVAPRAKGAARKN